MSFKDLFDDMKLKLKKSEEQPEQKPVEEEDLNNVTKMRSSEPAVKGMKRKYIYIVVGFFALLTVFALVFGLEEDSSRKNENDAAAQSDLRKSQAVQGEHLLNIPKDYEAQAEAEAKRKAEQEAKEAATKKEQESASKKKITGNVPTPPTVPQQRYTGKRELSPAEKARLAREEKRMQALESPIGYELQNKD